MAGTPMQMQGIVPNQPVQISAEWWMAYAPSGHAYYKNTTTQETTWVAPPGVSVPTPPVPDGKTLDEQAMQTYMDQQQRQPQQQQQQLDVQQQQLHPQQQQQMQEQQMQLQLQQQQLAAMQAMQAGGMATMQMGPGGTPTMQVTVPIPPQQTVQQGLPTQQMLPQAALADAPRQQGPVSHQKTAATESSPEITMSGSGTIPQPCTSFATSNFPPVLVQPMIQAGFQGPTPIQAHAWPVLQAGRDIVGIAKTGSGKTLGFLLPAFARMLQERIAGSPAMLVMAPTRELACQIDADAKKFAGPAGCITALAYGGAPKGPQLSDIRRRPHLLTGTPGRLNDFIEGRLLNLGEVKFLCLDEADRMLDMGFEPQIRKVIACIPAKRQTMMFTATWPKEVRRLAQDFFQDPVEVKIGNVDELQANADIDQRVIVCNRPVDKEHHVLNLIRSFPQAIVFTGTKRMCDQLARTIERQGVKCEAIHGDRDQRSRDLALAAFKSGTAKVLCATDVAARGLDIKGIQLVINYDPANNAEDYVHRIGRTGRAGSKGTAVTLLTMDDGRAAQQIAQVMQRTGKAIPPELDNMLSSGLCKIPTGEGRGRRRRSRSRSRGRGRSPRRSRSRGGGDRFAGMPPLQPGYGMQPGGMGVAGMPSQAGLGPVTFGTPGMAPGMGLPPVDMSTVNFRPF